MQTQTSTAETCNLTVEDIYSHAQRFNATQVRILDATRQCLKSYGVRKTSINDIARQARVTRPTVYAYFENKDDLVSAALMFSAYELARKILDQVAGLDHARERVLTAAQFAIENLPAEPYLALIAEVDLSQLLNERALGDLASQELLLLLFRTFFADEKVSAPELQEIIEVCTRFSLSMILIKGTVHRQGEDLRAFLERRLLPALGL